MREEDLKRADELSKLGELDAAWAMIEPHLENNPDDALALGIGSSVLRKAKKTTVAFHLARRAAELAPEKFAAWHNLARITDELWMVTESERAHRKAIKCAVNPKQKARALVSLAALYINCGEFKKAQPLCQQAVMADPELFIARANLGFCQLAARNWAEGWENYAYSLGTDVRKRTQYRDEPQWDGTPGLKVVIYGEQGLGDEISFASMFNDAIKDSDKVIIDCDKRLEGLFRRSFPKAKVYGTRTAKPGDEPWAIEDRDFQASIAMGGLGGFYRNTAESFTGESYLTPDPDRVEMWKALFASKGKPVIGIAWTGGMRHTGAKFRRWSLEDLLPLFKSVDAHWVSLEYKDAAKEIAEFKEKHPEVDLVQYPYGTLTKDYDDTAALVACLDRVVCIQTAVAHLAGSLGKECWVFVAKTSQWRYGESGEDVPWYKSVRVFRQVSLGQWDWHIRDAAYKLGTLYGSTTALEAAYPKTATG
jgi:tetratricopeptide (TPR) repeat protein